MNVRVKQSICFSVKLSVITHPATSSISVCVFYAQRDRRSIPFGGPACRKPRGAGSRSADGATRIAPDISGGKHKAEANLTGVTIRVRLIFASEMGMGSHATTCPLQHLNHHNSKRPTWFQQGGCGQGVHDRFAAFVDTLSPAPPNNLHHVAREGKEEQAGRHLGGLPARLPKRTHR